MLRSKSFVKKTKKGSIVKVVKEHYLRDDIGTGVGTVLEKNAQCYIIPDTNVILHQIDLLENPAITNVIILETVLDEVKNQNISVYNRLRAIIAKPERHFYVFSNEHAKDTYIERKEGESMNDRNDRAIRVAVAWYMRTLSESIPIFLITNDRENARRAQNEALAVKTVHNYVRELTTHPELLDLLNYTDEVTDMGDAAGNQGKMGRSKDLFEEHKPITELMVGIKSGRYHQGVIHAGRYNPFEAYVTVQSMDTDILVSGFTNINRAIDGDVVAVEILPEDQWKKPTDKAADRDAIDKDESKGEIDDKTPTAGGAKNKEGRPCGKVVGILKRNWRTYCGSIEEGTEAGSRSENVLFVPVDQRIPKIRIRTRQANELMTKRITVCIDKWSKNSKYPDGHYVGTLGDIGDKDVETEVVLLEHSIPHYQFSASVLACLPPDDWSITKEEIAKRRDLRSWNIFSVDPPGCKDIDDALNAHELPNGNYQVGVHIADVSHFVLEGKDMDLEAAKRGTTVYLVNKRIDMLPALLTENLCSLRSNVERLAFSVIWEMTPDAEIVNVEFTKSVIKSRAAMTYAEAQAKIDDTTQQDPIARDLRSMMKLARILRQKRRDKGALDLASPEVKFELDSETMDPTEVGVYQTRDTNFMVEEFMLLANVTVAEKIYKAFPTFACLRRHPLPNPSRFETLNKCVKAIGLELKYSNSKELSQSLDQAVVPGNPYLNTLIRILTTRCMQQAVYFSSGEVPYDEFYHYGLAAPIYTHFTSPIRRYADVIVHRLLAASIGIANLSETVTDKEKMREICDGINMRNRMAQFAGRASADLHTMIYFRNKVAYEDAYIMRIMANSVSLFIPRYGIETIVYVCEKGDSNGKNPFTFNDDDQSLSNNDIKLRVFDRVRVQIYVETNKNYRQRLVVNVIEPKLHELLNLPMAPQSDELVTIVDGKTQGNVAAAGEEDREEEEETEPESKKRRKGFAAAAVSQKKARKEQQQPAKKKKKKKTETFVTTEVPSTLD